MLRRLPRSLTGFGRTPVQRAALLVAGTILVAAVGHWTTADSEKGARSHRGPIPADVSGNPLVLDGDTIDIRGVRVRLYGIDAPERDQSCKRADGSTYACGQFARDALVAAIADGPVTCVRRDVDPYGRMVGLCKGPGGDLGETLVAEGAAMAYRHFSRDYIDEEDRARAAHVGLWQGQFEAPWDYRHSGHAKHPH
jgi:endonuclease YncB( thermonuclease family)